MFSRFSSISLCVSCSLIILVMVSPAISRSISICVVPSLAFAMRRRTMSFPLVFIQYALGFCLGLLSRSSQ